MKILRPQKDNLENIPIRGSIADMAAYLGEASLSADEYIKHKPQVPLGLLRALGMESNTVPLPAEDAASFVMNATQRLMDQNHDEVLLDFVEVGTETIQDGSLPLSQYAIEVLGYNELISSESKHACVAAMNAIWQNMGDNGLVISTDLAHYADDDATAASAEFTGGAGSVVALLQNSGKLLDIADVKGSSSELTHDFYKPYTQLGDDLMTKTYPVVFGKYSNLANLERVGKAYENLLSQVDVRLDEFKGIVFHIPYPGITKYNLAMIMIIDQMQTDLKAQQLYNSVTELFKEAHDLFRNGDLDGISPIEKQVKSYLKEMMLCHEDGEKLPCPRFQEIYTKLEPSLRFIAQTGNLYTGSSPLGMMSLLEHVEFDDRDLILWGGYGSGNEAIFMIAQTTSRTTAIASRWQTQRALDKRDQLTADDYILIKNLQGSENWQLNLNYQPSGFYLVENGLYNIRRYERSFGVRNQLVRQESVGIYQ